LSFQLALALGARNVSAAPNEECLPVTRQSKIHHYFSQPSLCSQSSERGKNAKQFTKPMQAISFGHEKQTAKPENFFSFVQCILMLR